MSTQPIYFILLKGEKFIDFNTALYLYSNPNKGMQSKRATLWRYLRKNKKIKKIKIQNKVIYSFNDILDDTVLLGNMENITSLLSDIEN